MFFCRGWHGFVPKCVLHVQHAYFHSLGQSNSLICGVVVAVLVVDAKAP